MDLQGSLPVHELELLQSLFYQFLESTLHLFVVIGDLLHLLLSSSQQLLQLLPWLMPHPRIALMLLGVEVLNGPNSMIFIVIMQRLLCTLWADVLFAAQTVKFVSLCVKFAEG